MNACFLPILKVVNNAVQPVNCVWAIEIKDIEPARNITVRIKIFFMSTKKQNFWVIKLLSVN